MATTSQNKTNEKFPNFWGCIPDATVYASGRIDILGNQIDYNDGFILSTATDFYIYLDLVLYDLRKVAVIDRVKFPHDYVFVIVNSMNKHTLAESGYALRKESCKRAVECMKKKYPEIKTLRDASPTILENAKKLMNFTDYRIASHIVSENDLALKGMQALKSGNVELFGSYLYFSHESFRKYFYSSYPELDYLIELSKSIPGCIGAKSVGSGVCGISIHLVKKSESDKYRARIATAFKLQTNTDPRIIFCGIANSVEIF